MGVRAKAVWVGAVAALVVVTFSACGKFASLQARSAFKTANTLYQQKDYRKAADNYEKVVKNDPGLTAAYFFLGNSYDNLYMGNLKGQPANDELMTKAIANYKLAAEKELDPNLKKLALQYLVAAYGPEKLNDPSQAEPVVRKMIEMDPKEPSNYFMLSKIYEDAGSYDEAEALLLKAKESRPNDSSVYMQLAGYYNRQSEYDKMFAALEQRSTMEPNNPEAHYTLASFYWDMAYRDFRLNEAEKKNYISKGLSGVDRALEIRPDYIEALIYRGLLLRLEANLEKNADRQKVLMKEAEELQSRAKELQKKKTEGIS